MNLLAMTDSSDKLIINNKYSEGRKTCVLP